MFVWLSIKGVSRLRLSFCRFHSTLRSKGPAVFVSIAVIMVWVAVRGSNMRMT